MLYLQLAIICVAVLVFIYQRLFKKPLKTILQIPGPNCEDKVRGHLDEIQSCGSLHQFLEKYHMQYGPIISFHFGPQVCVSIASGKLFQEHAAHFDRPVELFEFVIPLIGNDTIQLANGDNGRWRHAAYSKAFNTSAVRRFYSVFSKTGKDLVENWSTRMKEGYILLQEQMYITALRSILISMFGEEFDDDRLIMELKAAYDFCWLETEKFAVGDIPPAGSARLAEFDARKEVLYNMIKKVMSDRKELPEQVELHKRLPVDEVLGLDLPDPVAASDLLTLLIGGFHTTATLLSWSIYYLAAHQDVQDKCREEVLNVLGSSDQVMHGMAEQLKYLQQVLKESIRTSQFATVAARVSDSEIVLGGYTVPPKVPVVQALGLSFYDENVFPQPDKFDPDRFSCENEAKLPPFSFEPFGFAGKRKCPGYNFSFAEVKVILSLLLRAFRIELAHGQVAEPLFGFVVKIKDDIWLSVTSIS